MSPDQAQPIKPLEPIKREPHVSKPGALRTIRRGLAHISGPVRTALLALTVATGAGAAHHATGFEVPGPIPAAGIVDNVGSTIVGVGEKIVEPYAKFLHKEDQAIEAQKDIPFATYGSDGTIFVKGSVVDAMHVSTFGGTQVVPGSEGYSVKDPAINKIEGYGLELVVNIIDANGKKGYGLINCVNPEAPVGTANQDTIVQQTSTVVGMIDQDHGTVNGLDGTPIVGLNASKLSQATPYNGPLPTPQP